MEEFQTEINTLCGLLPQNVPFVMQQVSEAIKICLASPNAERNLDIAIKVAEQISKYSKGDLLYNYTPILIALLKDTENAEDLKAFDTIDHVVPIGVSTIKQFLDNYGSIVKPAANSLATMSDNLVIVIFANMIADAKENKNILPIAYIMTNLNISHIQYVNGTFQFYCDLLSAINKAEF